MKTNKLTLITCPYCGCEYLPAEIYMPKHFFGKPTHIKKDIHGKIMDFDGDSVDIYEVYCCDHCNLTFKVAARLMFTSIKKKGEEFEEEFSTPLNTENLFLMEDPFEEHPEEKTNF